MGRGQRAWMICVRACVRAILCEDARVCVFVCQCGGVRGRGHTLSHCDPNSSISASSAASSCKKAG